MNRLLVLANDGSGTHGAAEERRLKLEAAFEHVGPVEIQVAPGHALADLARAACEAGAPAVAAAGGDGTVSAVAGALAGSRTALAVLPMGTLNHFARDLGIPLDLAAAARVAVGRRTRRVDVATANGHVFVNNASMGAYVEAVQQRDAAPHPLGSKRLGSVRAAFRVLRQFPRHRVRVVVDGQPEVRTTPFVLVGNNVYSTSLGSFGTRDAVDAGVLSVYLAHSPRRRHTLALAARTLVGRLEDARDFVSLEGKTATLDVARRRIRLALDGELVKLATPVEFRSEPGALLVRVPKPAPVAAKEAA